MHGVPVAENRLSHRHHNGASPAPLKAKLRPAAGTTTTTTAAAAAAARRLVTAAAGPRPRNPSQLHEQPQQPAALQSHASSSTSNEAAQALPTTLAALLAHFQQQQRRQQHQQQQQQQRGLSAAEQAVLRRLQRKLTAVLTDSCTSCSDVSDVLLAAESAGCLNELHVAAALSTLARLADARRAAAAAAASGRLRGRLALAAQVPLRAQLWGQMLTLRQAAAAAASMAADSGGSRWHAVPSESAAWQEQQEQEQHLLQQLSAAVEQFWPVMSAATATSCCWSLAVLQQVLPASLLPRVGTTLLLMAQSLLAAAPPPAAGPGQDSAGSWQQGQSTMGSSADSGGSGVEPPGQQEQQLLQQTRQQYAASPRQVVVLLWSLASMQVDPGDLHPATAQPGSAADGATSSSSSSSSSSSLVLRVLHHLQPSMPRLSSQGVVLLAWALGSWRMRLPQPVAHALLAAAGGAMDAGALGPRELAVLLWAAAHCQLAPELGWLAAWLARMRDGLAAANCHDLAMSAWALAALGLAPPAEWLTALSARAGAAAGRFSAAELPALLWGLARLRWRPPASVAAALLERGRRLAAAGQLSPQGLALLLWSAGRLRLAPRPELLDELLEGVCGLLPLFRAAEASGLLVGLVALGHIPQGPWMDDWWAASQELLPAADGQQVVLLLWGGVQLGQRPPGWWLAAWQQASSAAMASGRVSGQGYGLMWAALQQLEGEALLPAAWLRAFWAASSRPAVLAGLDCLAAERTLSGLAGLADAAEGRGARLVVPGAWSEAFFRATLELLPGANLINLSSLLLAAGQLGLAIPQPWLQAAMERLARLAAAAGLLPDGPPNSDSGSSGLPALRSYALAARLQRRRWRMLLTRVLSGLRAQQMLAPVAIRQRQPSSGGSGADPAATTTGSVILQRWPWLGPLVLATWPNGPAAQAALNSLG